MSNVNLGGQLAGSPTVSALSSKFTNVYDLGLDGVMFVTSQLTPHGAWTYWQNKIEGTELFGNLVSADWSGYREDVFCRGAKNQYFQTYWDGSNGYGQRPLGNGQAFLGDFTVVSRGYQSLDIFARGTDNALYWLAYNTNTSSSTKFQMVNAGPFSGDPTVVRGAGSGTASDLHVFIPSDANEVMHLHLVGSNWTTTNLGGFAREQLTAVSGALATGKNKNVTVFSRNEDNNIQVKFWRNSEWSSDWAILLSDPGETDSTTRSFARPSAVAWADDIITLAVTGADNKVYIKRCDGTDTTTWLGNQLVGQEAATSPPVLHPLGGSNSSVFFRNSALNIISQDFSI